MPQFDQPVRLYSHGATSEFIWFRLRQLADVPEQGMTLFNGSLPEKRQKYRYFRAFVHQAQVYWDAAETTRGSAAALPYYYAALQLAKAELLKTVPERLMGVPIGHGLSHKNAAGTKIAQDRLRIVDGVFPLLFEKRTGHPAARHILPKVMALLSMIPELGMEMETIGTTRVSPMPGYHALARDTESAWSVLAILGQLPDGREAVMRTLLSKYEEVDPSQLVDWRSAFAVSPRFYGNYQIFQATKRHALPSGTPDVPQALKELHGAMGVFVSSPTSAAFDYWLTSSVTKSDRFAIPLSLMRYALIFYLSSVVRYQPIKLDADREGAQAYLMDSLVHEVPLHVLAAAWDGITGNTAYFEPAQMRN